MVTEHKARGTSTGPRAPRPSQLHLADPGGVLAAGAATKTVVIAREEVSNLSALAKTYEGEQGDYSGLVTG
jgi:hypothetical protein